MKKYFIKYNDLKKDNKLNFELSPYNDKLKIIKRYKDNTIFVEPILYFLDYIENIDIFVNTIESRKKNISFVFELTEEEMKKYDSKLIEIYDVIDNGHYKKVEEEKELTLLKYNILKKLKVSEINNGNLVLLKYNNGNINIENLNDTFFKYSLKEFRYNLKKDNILNDIYFSTNNKKIIEENSDLIIKLEKNKKEGYRLINHSFVAIDSIRSETVNTFNSDTFRILYSLCNNSVPYYISSIDNYNYSISNIKEDGSAKIYVILDDILKTSIFNKNVEELLKYINVYELSDGKYIKKSIEDYLENKDILKYIKKVNN